LIIVSNDNTHPISSRSQTFESEDEKEFVLLKN